MADYPKRLYLPGKLAVTVKSAAEEEAWVHPPAPPKPAADAAPNPEPEPAADAATAPAPDAAPEA